MSASCWLCIYAEPQLIASSLTVGDQEECLMLALSQIGWGCRVAVPGQGDPIIAITCISHASSQATAKAQPAAPAAELQLEGVTGEDEGLEGGLEGDLEGNLSAEEGVSVDTCM